MGTTTLLLPVTTITASLLGLFLVKLSLDVIKLRRANKVSLGHSNIVDLERAMRAQGNFAEYVPTALILLGLLEWHRAPLVLVIVLAALFAAGRWFHAKGIVEPPPHFKNRIRGMKLTLYSIIGLAVCNLVWLGVGLSQ
ncbi:MAG: hypothetical protein RL320_179 [Pseudomonadota bacterium]|jgi:uncharacterized membrane protein YecN with MAPEG domain